MHRCVGFLLILCLAVMLSVVITGCSDNDEDTVTSTPPLFTVAPVDISGPYEAVTETYGDIKFTSPVLIPFGDNLSPTQKSPAIEYYTIPDAPVRAVCEGLVTAIIENPVGQADWEIHVTVLPGSRYTIIYDHVLDYQVLENTLVLPGDTIGEAGTWSADMRRVELQVNYRDDNDDEKSYCPLNFGDSVFNAQHNELLQEYNTRGFFPMYDTMCVSGPVEP